MDYMELVLKLIQDGLSDLEACARAIRLIEETEQMFGMRYES